MSKVINEIATRCELALKGLVVPVRHDSEVQIMFDYILSACSSDPSRYEGADDVLTNRIRQYSDTNDVAFIVTNTVFGMKCITFLLKSSAKDEDERFPDPLEESYGTPYKAAMCYVFNIDGDEQCSEFGDVFFQKQPDGFFHRVG